MSWIARRLRWLFWTALVLEALYLVLANGVIFFVLRHEVNKDENTKMEYRLAYSLLPTLVHAEGFRVTNQDTSIEWSVYVDKAYLSVDLPALLHKKFHATRIRAEGVKFFLRSKLNAKEADDPRALALPPIPGFADPPMRKFLAPAPPLTDAKYNLWTVQLDDVDAQVEEVWVTTVRAHGPGRVRGQFFFKPLRALYFGPLDVDFFGVDVSTAERVFVQNFWGQAVVQCGHHDPRLDDSWLIRAFSGRINGEGIVPDVSAVQMFAGAPLPVRLEDGSGQITIAAKFRDGIFLPGSRVAFKTDHLGVVHEDVRIDGGASVEARAVYSIGGSRAEVDVAISHAELRRPHGPPAQPIAADVDVAVRGVPADLLALHMPTIAARARGAAPELRWIGDPVIGGSGRATVAVFMNEDGVARGDVHADLSRAELASADRGLRGDVAAAVGFDRTRFDAMTGSLRGATVDATHLLVKTGGVWRGDGRARVAIDRGRLEAGAPRDVVAHLDAWLEDAGMLANDDRMGLLTGRARASADVSFARPDDVTARVDATVRGAALRFPMARAFGDLAGHARLVHGDLQNGVGQVIGASLVAERLTIRSDRPGVAPAETSGWLRVDVPQLDVDGFAPLGFRADVDARLGDVGALIGLKSPVHGATRLVARVGRARGGDPAEARVTVDVRGARAFVDDTSVTLDAHASATVVSALEGSFATKITRGHVSLGQVGVEGAPSCGADALAGDRGTWRAEIDVPVVELGDHVAVVANARAKDASAPLDLLRRLDLVPGIVASTFRFGDLDARAVLREEDGRLVVRLDIAGDDARIRGALANVGKGMTGDLVASSGIVSAGIHLEGGKTQIKLLAGESWLREHLATLMSPDRKATPPPTKVVKPPACVEIVAQRR